MRELFIYYRLRSGDAARALTIAREFQSKLIEQHPHLMARLLRRPDETDGWQTWMEIYSTDDSADPMRQSAGITADLQQEIESRASVLLPMIDGARHTEVFIECAW